jgi:hypothetical protein
METMAGLERPLLVAAVPGAAMVQVLVVHGIIVDRVLVVPGVEMAQIPLFPGVTMDQVSAPGAILTGAEAAATCLSR